MAQIVIVTLTSVGLDAGPFNIYSDADGYAVPVVTGVSKASLLAGYAVSVPDSATIIKVLSTGVCINYELFPITITTTTTTSSSSSTSTTTSTSSSSTTTTTTTCATPTLYLASVSGDACAQTGGQLLSVIGFTPSDECDYCNFTTLNSPEITALANGTYYVSDGTNVRAWTKASTPSNLFDPTTCTLCEFEQLTGSFTVIDDAISLDPGGVDVALAGYGTDSNVPSHTSELFSVSGNIYSPNSAVFIITPADPISYTITSLGHTLFCPGSTVTVTVVGNSVQITITPLSYSGFSTLSGSITVVTS